MAEHEVHVTIDNTNNSGILTLIAAAASHGSYKPSPPPVIEGNTSGSFVLIANAGFYGAEGSCSYATADGGTISLTYGDPITADNYATVDESGTALRVSWEGKTGSGGWQSASMPTSGDPVYLKVFVVS